MRPCVGAAWMALYISDLMKQHLLYQSQSITDRMKLMDFFGRQGRSRKFGQPAARLRSSVRLQAHMRPARVGGVNSWLFTTSTTRPDGKRRDFMVRLWVGIGISPTATATVAARATTKASAAVAQNPPQESWNPSMFTGPRLIAPYKYCRPRSAKFCMTNLSASSAATALPRRSHTAPDRYRARAAPCRNSCA